MAKHKAATEITIAQEERSAFADFVDQYKWIGLGILVVISAAILWMNRSKTAKTEGVRSNWNALYEAGQSDDPAAAFVAAATEVNDPTVAALAYVNQAVALTQDREYGTAEQAIAQALKNAPEVFNKVTFPIGKEGAEETLLAHLQESISNEAKWMADHKHLFENEPLPADAPKVEINTDMGRIVVGLYTEKAPQHVKNFLRLVQEGYYVDTRFHRIQTGEFIQGGDPNSKEDDASLWGLGGTEPTIPPEDSGLVHAAGVLAAAKKSNDPNSSGSQFYITASPMHGFDGNYVVYGAVIEGLEIVEEISNAERRTDKADAPVSPVTIKSTTVLE